MKKPTTEQLLFAHRIGATHRLYSVMSPYYKSDGDELPPLVYNQEESCWEKDKSRVPINRMVWRDLEIDFTPLYTDWIDHDGGECPVRDDDMVNIKLSNSVGGSITVQASLFDWGARGIDGMLICKSFKLCRAEDRPEQRADNNKLAHDIYKEINDRIAPIITPPLTDDKWPEQRADADGEHYAEALETNHSTAHHKRADGTDLIDDWWDTYPPEVARVLMWEQVRKYMNRLGKKDPVHVEVSKMANYLRRWDKKERELAGVDDKPNTIV